MISGILFTMYLFVCLFSTLTFTITFELYEVELHILHAYSTNDDLSNNTKVNDLVTLTQTFVLKIAFSDFVATWSIVLHKHVFLKSYLYILFICIYIVLLLILKWVEESAGCSGLHPQ